MSGKMGSVTAQIVGDDDKNNSVCLSKWGFYEDFGQRETGENVVFSFLFFFKGIRRQTSW